MKTKSSESSRLPTDQRCQYLIGPVCSWFVPNVVDVWSQYKTKTLSDNSDDDDLFMDCETDLVIVEDTALNLSYFIYGAIGCFCVGEIHPKSVHENTSNETSSDSKPTISAVANKMIDIKDDNSRVSCVRFLNPCTYPLAMVLTETGSLVIHNCLTSKTLVHYKKSELINKLVGPTQTIEDTPNDKRSSKKPRFDVTQQINSFCWPSATDVFIAVSLLKQKQNKIFWLKTLDVEQYVKGKASSDGNSILKTEFIKTFEALDLKLPQTCSPVCIMESVLLADGKTCLIALGMDDGLIVVAKLDLKDGKQMSRVVVLGDRHRDQICSMSFCVDNLSKFPLGVLASVSRNGLVLLWDIENEFYFADYMTITESRTPNVRVNWFAVKFITTKNAQAKKHTSLLVSNCDSNLCVLDLPENTRSKVRLRDNRANNDSKQQHKQKQHDDFVIKHHALIFDIAYDPLNEVILTTSLDTNHILWNCKQRTIPGKNGKRESMVIDVSPSYMFTSMPNNSRTHMLRHSPIREDWFAMTLGKAGIRYYQVTESVSTSKFVLSPSAAFVSRRIMKSNMSPVSIAWHPSHEYRSAVGTLEGKVLRVDLTPRKAAVVEATIDSRERVQFAQKTKTSSGDPFGVEYQPMLRGSDDAGDILEHEIDRSKTNGATQPDGVYSICWGPNPTCPRDITRLAIYAVKSASHRLVLLFNRKESADKLLNFFDEVSAEDMNLAEASSKATEIAWKPTMDLMALGTTEGKVIVATYETSHKSGERTHERFQRLAEIECPLGCTYVQCLAWHPTRDKFDTYYHYLAVSTKDTQNACAHIFDLKDVIISKLVSDGLQITDKSAIDQTDYISNIRSAIGHDRLVNFTHRLNGHTKPIADIQWNPHEPSQLATASFDKTCYVWNLTRKDAGGFSQNQADGLASVGAHPVARFLSRDRLFTVEWSLVDEDLVFTSGNDSTVWAWRPSENQHTNLNVDTLTS